MPSVTYAERAASVAVIAVKRRRESAPPLDETDWRAWLAALFPIHVAAPFAPHHADYWDWLWELAPDVAPPPFIGVWPRGGGKSSSVELGIAALAARGRRSYGLYICESQAQADDHVSSVARLLESTAYATAYPQAAARGLGKFNNPLGWRQNRLRTASGFTLDAVGLDTAARGVKLERQRPDLIILDDIDSETDGEPAVQKKMLTLTTKLLPAGSSDAAVLGVQNLVHRDSVFSRLVDGRADFLHDRIVSGPVPAIQDAAYEQVEGRWAVVAGTPTWSGQDLAICQAEIARFGLGGFRTECQHEVEKDDSGMFGHIEFRHVAATDVPDPVRSSVWVDPAVTDTDHSDSHGVQADGIAVDGTIYRLYSWEQRASPDEAIRRAIVKAVELGADCVGVETNQGGDTWRTVYDSAWKALVTDPDYPQITATTHRPAFRSERAGVGEGSKAHRASQMLADYEQGRIVHMLGTHETLERALRRFPIRKPLDLVDAAYWSWRDVRRPRRVVAY